MEKFTSWLSYTAVISFVVLFGVPAFLVAEPKEVTELDSLEICEIDVIEQVRPAKTRKTAIRKMLFSCPTQGLYGYAIDAGEVMDGMPTYAELLALKLGDPLLCGQTTQEGKWTGFVSKGNTNCKVTFPLQRVP